LRRTTRRKIKNAEPGIHRAQQDAAIASYILHHNHSAGLRNEALSAAESNRVERGIAARLAA
jgi:hypothetical protein